MYNGNERRSTNSGRRTSDKDFCAEHHIIQEDRKEHRGLMCNKIADLKKDYLKDIDEVKYKMDKLEKNVHHKADVDLLNSKANSSDLRGLMKFMSVMVGICCIVIAGQALWLKSDISHITDTFVEQIKKLSSIEGDIGKINLRLTQIEIAHQERGK
jgi:hypothetical protein